MVAPTAKRIPLSKLRSAVRRAQFIARYARATMGLEGQATSRSAYRALVRRTLAELLQASAA